MRVMCRLSCETFVLSDFYLKVEQCINLGIKNDSRHHFVASRHISAYDINQYITQ